MDDFLSDLATLQELFSNDSDVDTAQDQMSRQPQAPYIVSAGASTGVERKKPTPHEVKVQALRKEIKTLRTHLECREEYQQQVSAILNWRQGAIFSRIVRQKAQRQTKILKKRIASNRRLFADIMRLVDFQKQRLPAAAPKVQGDLLIDEEMRILSILKENLDARYGHVDSLVDRSRLERFAIHRLAYPSIRSVDVWTPFVLQRGAGVKLESTEIFPFDVMIIQKAAALYFHLNANSGSRTHVSDYVRRNRMPREVNSSSAAIDQVSGGKEFYGRMVLRVVGKNQQIMLMWEHTFHWQANEDIQTPNRRVIVRDSGFALIVPCLKLDGEASVVHWSSSVSMHALDESILSPQDPRVRRIIKSCLSWYNVHISSIENKLMENKIGDRLDFFIPCKGSQCGISYKLRDQNQ